MKQAGCPSRSGNKRLIMDAYGVRFWNLILLTPSCMLYNYGAHPSRVDRPIAVNEVTMIFVMYATCPTLWHLLAFIALSKMYLLAIQACFVIYCVLLIAPSEREREMSIESLELESRLCIDARGRRTFNKDSISCSFARAKLRNKCSVSQFCYYYCRSC